MGVAECVEYFLGFFVLIERCCEVGRGYQLFLFFFGRLGAGHFYAFVIELCRGLYVFLQNSIFGQVFEGSDLTNVAHTLFPVIDKNVIRVGHYGCFPEAERAMCFECGQVAQHAAIVHEAGEAPFPGFLHIGAGSVYQLAYVCEYGLRKVCCFGYVCVYAWIIFAHGISMLIRTNLLFQAI